MQERIQYVATDFLINTLNGQSGVPTTPTLESQCSKLAWYPTLNMGVQVPPGIGDNGVTDATIKVNVQMTFSLRFRGVRFQGANKNLLLAGDAQIAPYGVFRAIDRTTQFTVDIPAGTASSFAIDMSTVQGEGNKIITFDNQTEAYAYRDTYKFKSDVSNDSGTNAAAVQKVLMNIRVTANNKNAQSTTSNGVPGN